ncbi:hypothetical protein EC991_011370 [Linnemannia zychae]|nr:hypothetical protein EC991_011370 [Linnemannia zychae]
MGRLKLDCITVNYNNTIIYGLGSAFRYDVPEASLTWGTLVLIRSQPNPSSFRNIRWSVVATINAPQAPTFWDPDFGTVTCAVNKAGVFSALIRDESSRSSGKVTWRGVKYDPGVAVGNSSIDNHWVLFSPGSEYVLQTTLSPQIDQAIYLDQPVLESLAGPPPVKGAMRERLIHGVSGYMTGNLRLGSFGPMDSDWRDSLPSTWNLIDDPIYLRLGPDHAHVFLSAQGMISSFPLTNVTGPIPQANGIKSKDGLNLFHILPGTHEGRSFLACIGTNAKLGWELYFINNYLYPAGTTPEISPSYPVVYLPTIRPLQFVNIAMDSSNSTSSSKELVFGISITITGELYGINLVGNQTSATTPGQAFNGGYAIIEGPYDSFTARESKKPLTSDEGSSRGISWIAAILAILIGGLAAIYFVSKVRQSRRRDKARREGNTGTPARPLGVYQPPTAYEPQRQGQDIELGTPVGSHNFNSAARHDGEDVPPPYRP